MTTTLFVIANIKQLRTDGSFRILLPFFQISWGVGVLNSATFNSFHSRVEFGMILEGLRNFEGGGLNPPIPPNPPWYATDVACYFTLTHRLSIADISLHGAIISVYSEPRAKYTNTER